MASEFQRKIWREQQRAWRSKNKDRAKEQNHRYYLAHKEERRMKKQAPEEREKRQASARKYYRENRDRICEKNRQHRRKVGTTLDKVCYELIDLRRHLREFANGAAPSEDVLAFLEEREYFCRSDCENEIQFDDERCLACARKRLQSTMDQVNQTGKETKK